MNFFAEQRSSEESPTSHRVWVKASKALCRNTEHWHITDGALHSQYDCTEIFFLKPVKRNKLQRYDIYVEKSNLVAWKSDNFSIQLAKKRYECVRYVHNFKPIQSN